MKSLYIVLILIIFSVAVQAEMIAFLGVSTSDIEYDDYKDHSITDGYGILIDFVVPGSAADEAGFQKGMIIRNFEKEKVYTRKQFTRMLKNSEPDQKVKITILDKDQEKTVSLRLGEKEIFVPRPEVWMGVYLKADFDVEDFELDHGLMITRVSAESPAQKAGLSENDILLMINEEKLYSADQVKPMLKQYKPDEVISIKYWRDNEILSTQLILAERESGSIEFLGLDNLLEGLDVLDGASDLYDIWNSVGFPGKVHVLAFKDSTTRILGVVVSNVDEAKLQQLGIDNGLMVDKVIPDTPAQKGGLQPADIIISINGSSVSEFEDIALILEEVEFEEDFEVTVLRGEKKLTMKLTMAHISQEILEDYYSSTIENDIIKVIIDKDKPFDIYMESLDEMESKLPGELDIELKIDRKDDDSCGPR